MIDGARTSINAAVFYMTLLGGEVDGQIIFDSLVALEKIKETQKGGKKERAKFVI